MPTQVVLPKLDRLMTEGTIQRWLKKAGEQVAKGDSLAVIEAEKVTTELEAPDSGIFTPAVPEGSRVAVGQVIAHILAPGEKAPEILPPAASGAGAVPVPVAETREGPVEERFVRATPAARRRARELGVSLAQIKGTSGRGLVAEEVEAYAKKTKLAGLEDEVVPLTGWRKSMAEHMAQSARTTAQITTVAEVDATELVNLRDKYKHLENLGTQLTYTTFIVKAVAYALKEFPIMNSSLVDDTLTIHKRMDIGLAVAIEEGGLVVPVIRDADRKDLVQIARELDSLSKKAREHKLALSEVSAGTFTITNPGMMGVILDTPIIVVPQTGILGVGTIVKRPSVVNDQIVIRHIMYLSLSYDHRVIEGAPAIRFLQKVRQLLENPSMLRLGGLESSNSPRFRKEGGVDLS